MKADPELSDLVQAHQILSEHFNNVYRRLKIISSQILFLEIIALVAILFWVGLLFLRPCLPATNTQEFSVFLFLTSLIFGSLGACISGILRLEKSTTQRKIPEQLENRVYTIARPLVGAASAVAVVIFILAGIFQIGTGAPGLYMAAAFAAGFSERLLKFGVSKVEGERNEAK